MFRRPRLRRFAAALAFATALTGGALSLSASPAAAATPTCDGAGWIRLTTPVYRSGIAHWYLLVPADRITFSPDRFAAACIMREGANHIGVHPLQRMLNLCYNQGIAIDGDFGANTRRALENAQTWARVSEGAPVDTDGVYGPETGRAVRWPVYAERTPASHWACKRFSDLGR
jgi:hypothetical protein